VFANSSNPDPDAIFYALVQKFKDADLTQILVGRKISINPGFHDPDPQPSI
jgi:hypothetical protein